MKVIFCLVPAILCLLTLASTTHTRAADPSPVHPSSSAVENANNVGSNGKTAAPMSAEDRKEVMNQITERYEEFRNSERFYGFLFYSCVIAAALVSTVSALILKIKMFEQKSYTQDLAACLACLATVLITVNTTVGFNAMWRSNRFARIEVEALKIDCIKNSVEKDLVLERLRDVIKNQSKIEN